MSTIPHFLGAVFMPHGHCYLWTPSLIWLHAASDSLIALAYLSIPLALIYFVRKRRDVPYPTVFLMFGAFIVACGLTHALEVSTIWNSHYYFSGGVKALTAAISLATAVALVRVMPQALQIAGPAELKSLNESLEQRVQKRTHELEAANASLRRQIAEREHAETEVKRLNGLLARRVDELQALFNILPIGIAIAEDPECRRIRSNAALARMLGVAPETNISLSALPPDAPTSFQVRHDGRIVEPHELPIQVCAREGRPLQDVEETIIRNDGVQLELLANVVPLKDEEGHTFGCVGTFQDVTSLKSAYAATERLAAIVEGSGDAIIGTTPEGIVTDWNSAAERLFGYAAAEIVGQSIAKLYPEDEISPARNLARIARGEFVPESKTRRRRKDGSLVDVSVMISPIRDAKGRIVGTSKLVRDITEQKRAESMQSEMEHKLQETQKLESLGVLAGGIAHDFNNLLTGILGNASLARLDLPEDSPVLASIEQIELASRRAADLCRQMLAYSGRGRFVVGRLDFNELLTESTPLLTISAMSASKGCALRFNLQPVIPAILADAAQIRQAIVNLVINASEAMDKKGGVITIATSTVRLDAKDVRTLRFTPGSPPGEYVALEVTDNGCGMDESTFQRIFDPFFTTKFTGRGLGLAAVLGIVRGHKGALQVNSEPGRGSTFKLYFPAAPAIDAETISDAKSTGAGATRGSGRVLVVDDEAAVRTVAASILKVIGYATESACDGAEAVDIFKADPTGFDFVLLDLTMPRLGGEETFQLLREHNPSVPIVLMSGYDEKDAVALFSGKGLAGFLQKPFDIDALTEIVHGLTTRQ